MDKPSKPRALPAPTEPVVVLTRSLAERTIAASRESDRKRVILPLHKGPEERLHRMFNAMQPGTYVQPHRHLRADKTEGFLLLAGAIDFVVFDDGGEITLARRLAAGSDAFGIDLAPGHYHSFLVRAPDTLVYEVKPGPYSPDLDKDFAPWAPAEGSAGVPAYIAALEERLAPLLAS